jgi:hypothetical protein
VSVLVGRATQKSYGAVPGVVVDLGPLSRWESGPLH